MVIDRQLTLMGHILRRPENHIMYRVTCNERLVRPQQLYKRTGQPRKHWFEDNIERIHANFGMGIGQFDSQNDAHINSIKEAARNHDF